MRNFILLVFICFFSGVFAQLENLPVVSKNGENFYVYTVEKGNTLWSIQQKLGKSFEELKQDNPDLTEHLSEGQKIYVHKPVSLEDYTVQKGETLYGLSKKFEVSIEQLIEWNPSISDGLKKDQIIKVPLSKENNTVAPVDPVQTITPVQDSSIQNNEISDNPFSTEEPITEYVFNDSVVNHLVLSGETLYSISKRYMVSINDIKKWNNLTSTSVPVGSSIKIVLKKVNRGIRPIREIPALLDSSGKIVFERKNSYSIVYLLPFHFNYGKNYSKQMSSISTQFYMGAKVALDSLSKLGLKADVYFWDTENSSEKIQELLNSEIARNADVIIGPLLPQGRDEVAQFCKKNGIRMVLPVASQNEILKENPLVFSSVTSNHTLASELAVFNANEEYKRIVLVKPTKNEDIHLYEVYKEAFNSIGGIDKPILVEATAANFHTFLDKKEQNVFVYLSSVSQEATKFMSTLNKNAVLKKVDEIQVYGVKDWINFSQVNDLFKNKYHFRYATSSYVDYTDSNTIQVHTTFRKQFNTDFSKFAIQGFDVTTYFLAAFFMENVRFQNIMNAFSMEQVSSADGYRNKHAFIIEQRDYELVPVKE